MTTMKERPATNSRLAQWRMTWLIEHSTSQQLFLVDREYCSLKPARTKDRKRHHQRSKDRRHRKTMTKNGLNVRTMSPKLTT